MQDDILEVMVTEYKVLRGEMYKKFDHQIRIFAIVFSALGVIYGIAFAYENILILFIPIIIFPLGLRFQYSTRGVVILSRYLKELESQIKKKKNYVDWKGWTGFQNYYSNKEHSWLIDIVYDASARWLMFIAIPMGIAIWYSFTSNNSAWAEEICIFSININIYIWLRWIYIISILSSPFVVWIIRRLAKKKNSKEGGQKMNKQEKEQLGKLTEKLDNLDKKIDRYHIEETWKVRLYMGYVFLGLALTYFAIAITLTLFVLSASSLLLIGGAAYVVFFIFLVIALMEFHTAKKMKEEISNND